MLFLICYFSFFLSTRGFHKDAGAFARGRYIGGEYKKIFDELQLFHYVRFGKISYRKRSSIVYFLYRCRDYSFIQIQWEKFRRFSSFFQIQNDEIQLDKLVEMANRKNISIDVKMLSECINGEFSNKGKFFSRKTAVF